MAEAFPPEDQWGERSVEAAVWAAAFAAAVAADPSLATDQIRLEAWFDAAMDAMRVCAVSAVSEF